MADTDQKQTTSPPLSQEWVLAPWVVAEQDGETQESPDVFSSFKLLSIAQNNERFKDRADAFWKTIDEKGISSSFTNKEFIDALLAFKNEFEQQLRENPEDDRAIREILTTREAQSKTDKELIDQLQEVKGLSARHKGSVEKMAEARAKKFTSDLIGTFGKTANDEALRVVAEKAKENAAILAAQANKPQNLRKTGADILREGLEQTPEGRNILESPAVQVKIAEHGAQLDTEVRTNANEPQVIRAAMMGAGQVNRGVEFVQILSAVAAQGSLETVESLVEKATRLTRTIEAFDASPGPNLALTAKVVTRAAFPGIAGDIFTPIAAFVDAVSPETGKRFAAKSMQGVLEKTIAEIDEINQGLGTAVVDSTLFRQALNQAITIMGPQDKVSVGNPLINMAADAVGTVFNNGPNTVAQDQYELYKAKQEEQRTHGASTKNPLGHSFAVLHYPRHSGSFSVEEATEPVTAVGNTTIDIGSSFFQIGLGKFFKKIFGGGATGAATKTAASAAGSVVAKEVGQKTALVIVTRVVGFLLKFVKIASGPVGWFFGFIVIPLLGKPLGFLKNKLFDFLTTGGGKVKAAMSGLTNVFFPGRELSKKDLQDDKMLIAAGCATCSGCVLMLALIIIVPVVIIVALASSFGGGGELTGPTNYEGPQSSGPLQCFNYNVSTDPLSSAQRTEMESAIAAYPQIGLYNCLLQCPPQQVDVHSAGEYDGYYGLSSGKNLYFRPAFFAASQGGQARNIAHELAHQLNRARPDIFSAYLNGTTEFPKGYCGALGTYGFVGKDEDGNEYSLETSGETFAEAASLFLVGDPRLQQRCQAGFNFMSRIFNQCATPGGNNNNNASVGACNDTNTKTILAVGDSITPDYGHPKILGELLNQQELNARVVDVLTFGGQTPQAMVGATGTKVAELKPDFVLIHAGTNGVRSTPNENIKGIEDLIAAVRAGNPSATILLARIILRYDGLADDVRAFNQRISAFGGGNVIIVDMEGAVQQGETTDGVHPTDAGYRDMANVWLSALRGRLSFCSQ